VVSEKGTIRGTLAPVLDEFEVDFLPVGSYASATRVNDLAGLVNTEQPLLLLYLGDHDPSGRGISDMDFPRRRLRYTFEHYRSAKDSKAWLQSLSDEVIAKLSRQRGLEVRRIALTVADTEDLGDDLAFPSADKADDSRYAWSSRPTATAVGSWTP
jgi:hypothetical protein